MENFGAREADQKYNSDNKAFGRVQLNKCHNPRRNFTAHTCLKSNEDHPVRSETFDILRKYNIKLNPEKCAFGVGSGKFLGFLVSQRGINIKPNKIKVIEDIPDQLTSVKEVQRLTGRLASLSRFISRMLTGTERSKRYLSTPPLLSKPVEGEQLLIYLAVSKVAVSVVLVQEEEDPKASQSLRTKAARYCLVNEQLYRRSFQGPLARCLRISEVDYVMGEVHEGVYEIHSGADSLVLKLVRAGYYWPQIEQDAKTFV
nr:uncharacterized protein LOC117278486 [Nicotiana tomentosiformis]